MHHTDKYLEHSSVIKPVWSYVVVGLSPVTVTYTSDITLVLSKEFLDTP